MQQPTSPNYQYQGAPQQSYPVQYANVSGQMYQSNPYPQYANAYSAGNGYQVQMGQPVGGYGTGQSYGRPGMMAQQGAMPVYEFQPANRAVMIETQLRNLSRQFLVWVVVLAVLNVIGCILGIWGAAVTNADNTNSPSDRNALVTAYAILTILTFMMFWTMVLGYYAVKRENKQYLKCFLVWIVIWIIVYVILLIIAYGGVFFLLLIPLGISVFLSVRGRRINSLMIEKQMSQRTNQQSGQAYA